MQAVKVGDSLKHKLTGTEFIVTQVSPKLIIMKITKVGEAKGLNLGRVGAINKTSPAAIGISYEIISSVGLEEENTTANLDGGAGQPQTPNAFGGSKAKGEKIGAASKAFTVKPPTEHRWGIKWENVISKVEETLNEVSYRSFKTDEGTDKAKINFAIKEAYQRVLEAEKLISNASKLKMEVGADQSVFYKQSAVKFHKLAERINKLGANLRELNK